MKIRFCRVVDGGTLEVYVHLSFPEHHWLRVTVRRGESQSRRLEEMIRQANIKLVSVFE